MKQKTSFCTITRIIYYLLGIIPYLLIVYLVAQRHISINQTTILMVIAVALSSHLAGFFMMRKFSQQLRAFSKDAGLAVTASQKTPIEIKGNAPRELSDIALHFNTMLSEAEKSNRNYQEVTTKLMLYARDIEDYQKKIREESLIRQQLSRYVGNDLVDQIISSNEGLLLQNRKQKTTVLFADIRSFTTISEHMAPEKVIDVLNEYFDCMVDIIFEHYGILDKFVGDELMAVFGLVGPSEDECKHAVNAVNAAIAMQKRIKTLMLDFANKGYPVFEIGIGINTGDTVVGNVGSKNRMDYTVIGDTVNVAARLEKIAKGHAIIIGEETRDQCECAVKTTSRGEIKVKNRAKAVKCFQVIK